MTSVKQQLEAVNVSECSDWELGFIESNRNNDRDPTPAMQKIIDKMPKTLGGVKGHVEKVSTSAIEGMVNVISDIHQSLSTQDWFNEFPPEQRQAILVSLFIQASRAK
jgi:hypothetical protein